MTPAHISPLAPKYHRNPLYVPKERNYIQMIKQPAGIFLKALQFKSVIPLLCTDFQHSILPVANSTRCHRGRRGRPTKKPKYPERKSNRRRNFNSYCTRAQKTIIHHSSQSASHVKTVCRRRREATKCLQIRLIIPFSVLGQFSTFQSCSQVANRQRHSPFAKH